MNKVKVRQYGNSKQRLGAVLLVVLFVCMVVSVLSMTVIIRANRQMIVSDGDATRLKLDYLAEAGLEHARTLLLHPQDVNTLPNGYWAGDNELYIEAAAGYYDLTVTQSKLGHTPRCTYDVVCEAYLNLEEKKNGVRSKLEAQVRLDPCVAYWAGGDSSLPPTVTVNGDVYCGGVLTSEGVINGDVFADSFLGTAAGQTLTRAKLIDPETGQPFGFPEVTADFFSPVYNDGDFCHTPLTLGPNDCNNPDAFEHTEANPAGVLYYSGALTLADNRTISGTLVVDGNVTLQNGVTKIIPSKNEKLKNRYPALVVNGEVTVGDSAQLDVSGLVLVNRMVVDPNALNVSITGALFAKSGGVDVRPGYAHKVTITADPMLAAVKLSSSTMELLQWSPAVDAFYTYVKRGDEKKSGL